MGFKKYCLITIMDRLQTFILAIASRVAVFNYLNIVLMKHVILVRKLLLSQHMKDKKYSVWLTLNNCICISIANNKKRPLPDPLFPAALPARICGNNVMMAAIVLESVLISFYFILFFIKKNRNHLKYFGAPVVLHYDPL